MSDGWGLPMRRERKRNVTGDWWQPVGGTEWRRTTPHADTTDEIFDRLAEEYVAGKHATVAAFEAAIERRLGRYGLGSRSLAARIEAVQRLNSAYVTNPDMCRAYALSAINGTLVW